MDCSFFSLFELLEEYHIHSLSSGFILGGIFFLIAIINTDLSKISPIARKKIIQKIPAGVLIINKEEKIINANSDFRYIFGFRNKDIIGKPIKQVMKEYPEIYEKYKSNIHKNHQNSFIVDIKNKKIKIETAELKNNKDQTIGYATLFYDVTEQKRKEKKLKNQNEKLEKFASIVSHDLRNPLNVAKLNLENIKQKNQTESHEKIKKSLERMETLTNNLLTLAKHGETVAETKNVSLEKIIESTWQNIEKKDCKLNIKSDLGEIKADPNRLRELLSNILSNIIEHAGKDAEIYIGKLKEKEGFYIEDNGPGIPKEKREKVFEYGYSGSDAGTGIGLTIVKSIVEAHGWEINIKQGKKGGARFEIKGPKIKKTK